LPDDYITFRKHDEDGATEWRKSYRKLSPSNRLEFLDVLEEAHRKGYESLLAEARRRYARLLSHYYHA